MNDRIIPLTNRVLGLCLGAVLVASTGTALAQAKVGSKPLQGEVVKMVRIDALSGLMGGVGNNQLKSWQFFAEKFSASNPAGVKFEVTGVDNKLSPTESVNALKGSIDRGVRYIIQGNGSSVALALVDAINKHNERNPGKEVVYLDDSAVDPDLTNSKCSFWHFRFDADTTMKMEAMTTFMKDQKDIKKVYLFNQNYSHGQQVAKYAKEYLKRKRPDIEIVGEDLHPLAQVRDFSPYIAKIRASGADSVITGNWGSDLSLLIKAAHEGGYNGKFFTYYTGVTGTPSALGSNDDFYTYSIVRIFEVLSQAMLVAKSTDPIKVAQAMEGLRVKSSFAGEVEMRKSDHQLQQPLYMSVWQKADAKYPYRPENTDMTLAPVAEYPNYVSSTPTSCQMKRPGD